MWEVKGKKYYSEKEVKKIISEYEKQIKQLKKQLKPKLTEDIQQYRKEYYQKNIKPLKDEKQQKKENERHLNEINKLIQERTKSFFEKLENN